MDTFSMTDMGLLRNSNQDSVFCEENPIGRFPNLFLVADGMGGHKAGDLASRLCIAEMVKQIQSSTARTPVSAFEQAIEAANQKVYQCAKEDFDLAGMGTTVVGAMVEDDVAYIANIGDSRFIVCMNIWSRLLWIIRLWRRWFSQVKSKRKRCGPIQIRILLQERWGRMIPSDRIVLR